MATEQALNIVGWAAVVAGVLLTVGLLAALVLGVVHLVRRRRE